MVISSPAPVDFMPVGILGGGGHVGLPFGITLADNGYEVHLVDSDEERVHSIAKGEMPFHEPGAESLLNRALEDRKLHPTTELSVIERCDIVVCVIGTPIDEHHNPEMGPLTELIEDVTRHLRSGQLLVLRSTVYPGTTAIVRDLLADEGHSVGEDLHLSFAPERIAQHNALEEIVTLPQLVGAFDDDSFERTREFFSSFIDAEVLRLSPTEAELGKLFTNMWRYLTFAAANEFYLIAESFSQHFDVNINRLIDRTSQDYPRFDVPSPGANVGGPCLTKDGWFLVDNIPFNELVSAAYQINEGIPAQIVDRMAEGLPDPEKVAILGMTYKANSDDVRNSVSFKLRTQLRMKGYSDVVCVEPNVESRFNDLPSLEGSDWVILMTPHDQFSDLSTVRAAVDNEDALYCDIWGFWEEMAHRSDNGYFFGHQTYPGEDRVV